MLLYVFVILGLAYCNNVSNGYIANLENQVAELNAENSHLKFRELELEMKISSYESQFNGVQYTQQQRDMYLQQQRDWHYQNAQDHLRSAEFWRESGDDFLYESNMRQAQHELEMMP